VIDRRLSHVKLSCVPGQASSAKAYFGYGHLWQSDRRDRAPGPPSRPARRPAPTILEATERAVAYTLGKRTQGGWWWGFFGTPDVEFSDEWLTAYVAQVPARTGHERAAGAAHEAPVLLLTVPRRAGWVTTSSCLRTATRRRGYCGWLGRSGRPRPDESATAIVCSRHGLLTETFVARAMLLTNVARLVTSETLGPNHQSVRFAAGWRQRATSSSVPNPMFDRARFGGYLEPPGRCSRTGVRRAPFTRLAPSNC